jgi:RNA recognition motif-containing protein
MRTALCDESEIPEQATNRYTDFVHARDNQIPSRTVKITGLPTNHTQSNMNQLLEPVHEERDIEYNQGHPDDYYYWEGINIIHQYSPEPGVGLVQLEKPCMAIAIVDRFAGTYWKNATLNAKCVPDEEMEDLIVKERGEKDVMLFVAGIKTATTSTDIREMFKDFRISDVNMPPGGKTFCFVFLRQVDANAVLARFGNGFQWQGRTIRVSLSDKDKKKKKKTPAFGAVSASPAAPTVLPQDTTDLKLNNLPYEVADSNIRIIFEGFTVTKVIIKQGYAFVGIATSEVGRAIQELSGKMVGGRKMGIKVAERRKY